MCKCGGDILGSHKPTCRCTCGTTSKGKCNYCAPKLDLGKPVQTRMGQPARIICTDRKVYAGARNKFPVVALVQERDGVEAALFYSLEGLSPINPSSNNLINVPERIKGWINVYDVALYESKEIAEKASAGSEFYIKTIYVDIEK